MSAPTSPITGDTPGGAGAPGAVAVVGLLGGRPVGDAARAALDGAALVVGGAAQLERLARADQAQVRLQDAGVAAALDRVVDALAGGTGPVCVLASGDPGFFGIGRALLARLAAAPAPLSGLVPTVHPAPSAVSLAFARLGRPWDDVVVVSAHGRDAAAAMGSVTAALDAGSTVAVLTSPAFPPEAIGSALGASPAGRPGAPTVAAVHVCSDLAEPGEAVTTTDAAGLAAGSWSHRSVVVLDPPGVTPSPRPTLARALPVDELDHRDGMITKPEVRAVILARLALPATGVLWDLGAGSGSVAVEAALAAPGLDVVAVERAPADADRARANAARHGAALRVVTGTAPGALDDLADPDRVFVGGGGLAVLDAALARLRPGGRVVMACTALDTALGAYERLGDLVEVSVRHARPIGDGVRLAPDNPVLVAWGP